MKSMFLAAGILGTAIAGIIIAVSKPRPAPANLPVARGTHAMG